MPHVPAPRTDTRAVRTARDNEGVLGDGRAICRLRPPPTPAGASPRACAPLPSRQCGVVSLLLMSGGGPLLTYRAPRARLSASHPAPRCSCEKAAPALRVWVAHGAGQTHRKEPSAKFHVGKRGPASSAAVGRRGCVSCGGCALSAPPSGQKRQAQGCGPAGVPERAQRPSRTAPCPAEGRGGGRPQGRGGAHRDPGFSVSGQVKEERCKQNLKMKWKQCSCS